MKKLLINAAKVILIVTLGLAYTYAFMEFCDYRSNYFNARLPEDSMYEIIFWMISLPLIVTLIYEVIIDGIKKLLNIK